MSNARGTPLGDRHWCSSADCRGCQSHRFIDRDDAVRWLQALAFDPVAKHDVRRAALSCSADTFAVWRASEREVIGHAAELLISGRLRICGTSVAPEATAPRPKPTVAAPAKAPAAPPPATMRLRSVPAPAPDIEADLPAELDVAPMVDTLRAAARDGAPFCEVCRRDRKAA